MVRVFVNGPGDLGSIPGQVIRKTQKIVLDASLLNTQVRSKGKVEQPRERSSLQVTLDYDRQLYLLTKIIYYWLLSLNTWNTYNYYQTK